MSSRIFYSVLCLAFVSLAAGYPDESVLKMTLKGGKLLERTFKAINFLLKFGYLQRNEMKHLTEELLVKRLKKFQTLAQLPVTGAMDNATLSIMEKPRCGMKDEVKDAKLSRRKRRWALQGEIWDLSKKRKRTLTWKLLNSGAYLPYQRTRRVIHYSFAKWSRYANINFMEIRSMNADIILKFVQYDHDDGYPFDGRGGRIAHAFYPMAERYAQAGDVHFDNDEEFTDRKRHGYDLSWVATHEIGHSLGLEHSYHKNAVMYPWYDSKNTGKKFDLTYDDKIGIQTLYGPRRRRSLKTTEEPVQTVNPKSTAVPKPVTQETTTKEITTRRATTKYITTVEATTMEVTTGKPITKEVTTNKPATTKILTSRLSTVEISTIKSNISHFTSTSKKPAINVTTIYSKAVPRKSKQKETWKTSTAVEDMTTVPLDTKYDTLFSPMPNRTIALYTNMPVKSLTTVANRSVIKQPVIKKDFTSRNGITEFVKADKHSQVSTLMFKSVNSRYEHETQIAPRTTLKVTNGTVKTTPMVSTRYNDATSIKLKTLHADSGRFDGKYTTFEKNSPSPMSKTTTAFSKDVNIAKSDSLRTASRTTRLITRLYHRKTTTVTKTLTTPADKATTVSPMATQEYSSTAKFDAATTPVTIRINTRTSQSRSTQTSQLSQKPTERSRMDNPKGKKGQHKLKCPSDINAAVIDETTGWMYVFSGDKFYLVAHRGLTFGPLSVPDYFSHLKGNVTAAYLRWMTGFLVLFCGDVYYEYHGFDLKNGPVSVKELGMPVNAHVDAALVFNGNKKSWIENWWNKVTKTYLFVGRKYYRLNESRRKIDAGYPKYSKYVWRGLPFRLSGAVTTFPTRYAPGSTIFFAKEKYYVLNDRKLRVQPGHPKHIRKLLKCRVDENAG